jgi:hypothetical protein
LKPGLLRNLRTHFNGPGHKPSFRFNFFRDAAHELLIDRFHTTGDNRAYAWGRVDGKPGSFAVLALEGDAMAARVYVPGEGTYRVHYAGNGVHRVWQEKGDAGFHCALESSAVPVTTAFMPQEGQPLWLPLNYPVGCSYSGSPVVVDLLALYTPQALAQEGSLTALDTDIDIAVAFTNMAYVNSQVNVEMRLVGIVGVSYNESGAIDTDLSGMDNASTTPGLTTLPALRTSYGGDLVCLVESSAAGGTTGEAGVADLGGWASVELLSDLDLALAHETGHNFGCMHDRQTQGVPTGFGSNYGYRFVSEGVTFHDIMAYDPGIAVPYYSNPNVNYFGIPEGVPDADPTAADNANQINLTAPAVSANEPTGSGNTLADVDVTAPAPGAALPGVPGVTLAADATANNGGTIAQVDFYADSLYLGTSTIAPYQFLWPQVSGGSHFVTAHAIDNEGGIRYSCPVSFYVPASLPPPWVDQDVGPVHQLGTAAYSAGAFTIQSSFDNSQIDDHDRMHFVYQPFCGNGAVTARIFSQTDTYSNTLGQPVRAGVMFRQNLASGSPMVWAGADALNGGSLFLEGNYRSAGGAETTDAGPSINNKNLPYWVSLSRAGDVFQWAFSPDGAVWTTNAAWTVTIPMGTDILVGLAADSANPALLNTAVLDNVSVTMSCAPPTPTVTSTATQTPTVTQTPTMTLSPTVTISPTATPTLACALDVPSGSSVTLSNNTYNFCSVNVHTGGTLVIGGSVTLAITGNMNVDGTVNGNGNGYGSTFAPGLGPGAPYTGMAAGAGGGHGGRGGNVSGGAMGGPSYDSPTQPVFMGSQGGTGSMGYSGGNGGAALVVIAPTANVTINGLIAMNGANSGNVIGGPGFGDGGGGAGGTISIDAIGIYGSGSLDVIGGKSSCLSLGVTCGGSGGGGLIRVCASNHISFSGNHYFMAGSSGIPGGTGDYGNYYDCNPTFTPTPTLTSTPSSTMTVTPSPTWTITFTPTSTATSSSTATPTFTGTATPTFSPTPSFTFSPTSTPTRSATPTSSPTATQTFTGTVTPFRTATTTSTQTASNTPTSSSTNTLTSTFTQSPTPSATASPTSTMTFTATPKSPVPTDSFTFSPTLTSTPTFTMTMTLSPTDTTTSTPSKTPTSTRTATGTATPTGIGSFTATLTFTGTATSSPTITPTPTASSTPTYSFTATNSLTPSATFTSTASGTPTNSPTNAMTATPSFTVTATASLTPTETLTLTGTPSATLTASASPTPTESPVPSVGPGRVGLYPNPVAGSFVNVLSPANLGTADLRIRIFTVAFRKVLDRPYPDLPLGISLVLRLEDNWGAPLSNGLYYVEVAGPKGRAIGKLLVLR